MARVTVEDCIDKVQNRFELVLLASHRARAMSAGEPLTIERDRDKNPVVALREVAEETLLPEDLREDYIASLQKQVDVDEPEEDELSLIATPDVPEENNMTEEQLKQAFQMPAPDRKNTDLDLD